MNIYISLLIGTSSSYSSKVLPGAVESVSRYVPIMLLTSPPVDLHEMREQGESW